VLPIAAVAFTHTLGRCCGYKSVPATPTSISVTSKAAGIFCKAKPRHTRLRREDSQILGEKAAPRLGTQRSRRQCIAA
jgi:hypothetical protein